MEIRNKKITVVGLGNSGLEAGLLLVKEGVGVSVTDSGDTEAIRENAGRLRAKGVQVEAGCHTKEFLVGTELLVVSPGVEPRALPVRYAEKENIPIISELELGYRFCKGRIVAVTGTNGKSTVVSLLGEILRKAGIPVCVAGNIGNSLSGEVRNITKDTVVILEVSSAQLERVASFRPEISVILNITPDHLDRYTTFREYRDFKARIYENQKGSDTLVLNADDENIKNLVKFKAPSAKVLYFSARGKSNLKSLFELGNTGLKGGHNLENVLAAGMIAGLLGIGESSVKRAIESFVPLRHRFERIATVGGIDFIDDSKATNIDSTYRALSSLDRPTVLIAGGKDKNISYEKILPLVEKSVKKIVLIGETRQKMRGIFKGNVALEEKDSLEGAVRAAFKSASSGESVLLSPMCSSFDMFRDYKHRGEVFKKAVERLKKRGRPTLP
ncbi:MAG: UDP-N-acetylmuramoyl-L-alanine--D-glutamate ligase [Omnitrophica bacterium]|nr:UDP-N-acetylmuramoyl-L-alanine--D-glutamate ligase [Candidatus Omnitrophota bacterium]